MYIFFNLIIPCFFCILFGIIFGDNVISAGLGLAFGCTIGIIFDN